MQTANTDIQFPHWLKITRVTVDTLCNPPNITENIILEGKCRNNLSKSGGTSSKNGVLVSDYMISAPYNEIEISAGDLIEMTDRTRKILGVIVNSYNGNLGCQIWYNETSN